MSEKQMEEKLDKIAHLEKYKGISEEWPSLDLSGPMPEPEILAALLSEAQIQHDVREIGNGAYNHTFTPAAKTFIPELWADALLDTTLTQLGFPSFWKIRSKRQEREMHWHKIHRRQKRAAFRRRKRGLA